MLLRTLQIMNAKVAIVSIFLTYPYLKYTDEVKYQRRNPKETTT